MNYIDDRVNNQIKYYSKRGSSFKKKFYFFRTSSILCTSFIPFFTSLISTYTFFAVLVSLLGVFSVIFEGILSLFSFKDKWINYRMKAESLKRLKFLYLTKTYPYNIDDCFNYFVSDCEDILANEKKSWAQLNIKSKEK